MVGCPQRVGCWTPGLVVRAQQGDEAAFAAITQTVYGHFLQVAYRILRDRDVAEDATQQAIVRMWRMLPRLRDPQRFDAWSYRLLVNACYTEARRIRHWAVMPIDLPGAGRTRQDRPGSASATGSSAPMPGCRSTSGSSSSCTITWG